MALAIKNGQSFTDNSGTVHIQGYFRVINFHYSKDLELTTFYFIGHPNREARDNNLPPFFVLSINVSSDDFDNWFSPAVLIQNTNLETQGYNYLMQLKDSDDNLIYGNTFEESQPVTAL
jgi:hypothetical protein